jgi:hypothetical protein
MFVWLDGEVYPGKLWQVSRILDIQMLSQNFHFIDSEYPKTL